MRYWFGGQPADYVVSPGEQIHLTEEVIGYHVALVPGVRLWCYDHQTGERTTDLLDETGTPVAHLVTGEYGAIPRFRGPDEDRRLLIGPEPTGPAVPDPGEGDDPGEGQGRWLITTSDWPVITDRLDSRINALEDGGGGGGDDPGEVVATAHPLVWTHPGEVTEDRTSPHPVWNLEGKTQRVTTVRAQATITTGELTVSVLTIDPDTGTHTPIAGLLLDPDTGHAIVSPDAAVSHGTGLTVRVELGDTDDQAADVTVQVMIR